MKLFNELFLGPRNPNDFSKLPFPYIFHMHNHSKLLIHYYRQVLIIYLLLHYSNRIHHYNLSVHDISITKTDPNELFLFILDHDNQWMIHPSFGYHISIFPFFLFDCFYQQKKNRLIISEPTLIPSMVHLFKMIIPQEHSLFKFISECKYNISIPNHHPLYVYLYPMIDIIYQDVKEPIEIIEAEVRKLFDIFFKEFKVIEDYFPNQKEKLYLLLRDWVNILYQYKQDFWNNPDTTKILLKKILYQYLIDHHYHIPLKKIDLQKMFISLYLWTQWFEKLLDPSIFFSFSDENKHLSIILNCIDLFFEKDELHLHPIHHIRIFDFMNKSEYQMECSTGLYQQLLRVHPSLRANYLYNEISKN